MCFKNSLFSKRHLGPLLFHLADTQECLPVVSFQSKSSELFCADYVLKMRRISDKKLQVFFLRGRQKLFLATTALQKQCGNICVCKFVYTSLLLIPESVNQWLGAAY